MVEVPSQKVLLALLSYDPKTGVLTWRERPPTVKWSKNFNDRFAGTVAGTLDTSQHRQVCILGRHYMAHRVIWVMMTGEPPPDQIDHRDGKRDNNRWANLRPATPLQNTWNTKTKASSQTGLKGVKVDRRCPNRPYLSYISANGKRHFLGHFETPEEAHEAYMFAAVKFRTAAWVDRPA